jgi:hypothetical protein
MTEMGRPKGTDGERENSVEMEKTPWKTSELAYLWEKGEKESRRNYELFKAYCKLGPDRTIAKLSNQIGIKATTIAGISQQNSWQKRSVAYDEMVLKLRPSLDKVTVENSREAQLVAGRILLDLGLKSIELKNPSLISIDQATKILTAGAELERKALGEADVRVEISGNDMSRVQNLIEELELDAESVEILDEIDDYDPED